MRSGASGTRRSACRRSRAHSWLRRHARTRRTCLPAPPQRTHGPNSARGRPEAVSTTELGPSRAAPARGGLRSRLQPPRPPRRPADPFDHPCDAAAGPHHHQPFAVRRAHNHAVSTRHHDRVRPADHGRSRSSPPVAPHGLSTLNGDSLGCRRPHPELGEHHRQQKPHDPGIPDGVTVTESLGVSQCAGWFRL